ncbi:phosphate-starvation-inducible E [Kordia sp. SMS9]|uniref:phosphate-starvation-inducible PsiE family protein n=1 Tax=Kordia sp. SMS9 TaxID=2282170 RepID=UPI000E0CE029|nr:phosphate-starvation-inducible PsiE family protein [Kordia sp. SMS9]AXG69964.1 phosphate-starvation-inducible E [Kordia sp. SMS9]
MKKIDRKILNVVESIEKWIIIILLFSLLLVVVYTAIVFLGMLFGGIIDGIQNSFSKDNNIMTHLHQVFGGFLSVLIGIELLHTIKMYLKEDVVHVEIVLLVALIGVSRHVIDLDIAHMKPLTLFGISSLIIVLAGGYYLIKKVMRTDKNAANQLEKRTESLKD